MIVFDLACICGFTFEGWFQDRNDFKSQLQDSFIVCPKCCSHDIRKILSPVRYQCSQREDSRLPMQDNESPVTHEDVETALAIVQKYVEKNFEDVGPRLATEALKIHYGASERRNIRGVATEAEEEKLLEEGITLLKIPMLQKNENVN